MNCRNCGAPMPVHACQCEYCGTTFQKERGSISVHKSRIEITADGIVMACYEANDDE